MDVKQVIVAKLTHSWHLWTPTVSTTEIENEIEIEMYR